jgi:hypothetical protein
MDEDRSGNSCVEFAEGDTGNDGFFGVALAAGDEFGGNRGDERIFGTSGESRDLIVRGSDGDTRIELQPDETSFERLDDFFEPTGCFHSKRTLQGQEKEMLVATLADEFIETTGEQVENGIVGKSEREFFPRETTGGDPLHNRRLGTGQGDLEDVAGIISLSLGEPINFGCAAIPCFWPDLLGAVPVAERDVVDGVQRQAAEVDPVDRGGCILLVILLGAESLNGTMGKDEAWAVGRQRGVECCLTDPSAGKMTAESRTSGSGFSRTWKLGAS